MPNLWLHIPATPDGDITPPSACPRAGCDGRRFRLHEVVKKAVSMSTRRARSRGMSLAGTPSTRTPSRCASSPCAPSPCAPRTVDARRYRCLACGRTFWVYPAGVGRGRTTEGVARFAAALNTLGLGVRGISEVLALLGIALGKSRLHAMVRGVRGGLHVRSAEVLLGGGAGSGGAGSGDVPWIVVHGRRLAMRAVVDAAGNGALVIEGIDRWTAAAVDRWARETLASLGVRAEVVFPSPGRCYHRPAGRRGGCGRRLSRRYYRTNGSRRSAARGTADEEDAETGEAPDVPTDGPPLTPEPDPEASSPPLPPSPPTATPAPASPTAAMRWPALPRAAGCRMCLVDGVERCSVASAMWGPAATHWVTTARIAAEGRESAGGLKVDRSRLSTKAIGGPFDRIALVGPDGDGIRSIWPADRCPTAAGVAWRDSGGDPMMWTRGATSWVIWREIVMGCGAKSL